MTDDDLRAALAAADPARSADLDPLTSPRARELLERAMTSDLLTPAPSTDPGPSRRPWLAAAAAAVLVVAAGGTYLATAGDEPAGGEVVLALPGGDPTMMSCLRLSENTAALEQMSVALAGTVSAVGPAQVRLDVTRWYRGGDAGTVVLRNADERLQALLGTPDFQVGQDYLVSANDGSVSVCGLTGPVSPELQAAYDEAYGG